MFYSLSRNGSRIIYRPIIPTMKIKASMVFTSLWPLIYHSFKFFSTVQNAHLLLLEGKDLPSRRLLRASTAFLPGGGFLMYNG